MLFASAETSLRLYLPQKISNHEMVSYILPDEIREAVARRCSIKKVFLKILLKSQGKQPVPDFDTGVFLRILRNF